MHNGLSAARPRAAILVVMDECSEDGGGNVGLPVGRVSAELGVQHRSEGCLGQLGLRLWLDAREPSGD